MNKKTLILFNLIFHTALFGQFNQKYYGFGLDIGSHGSGFFITGHSIHHSKEFSINGEMRFYDIKANNETIVYNPIYGQFESVGGLSLVMIPILIGANYYPFNGLIENNFSPFIALRTGYVISLDGKEDGSFSDRWKNPNVQLSPGGFLGTGIDFQMYGQTSVSTMIGLEILPLKDMVKGSDNHGMLIHIAFNRRIGR